MESSYNTSDYQIFDSQNSQNTIVDLPSPQLQLSSNSSSLQEHSTQLNTSSQQRTNASTANSSRQNEQQQIRRVIICYCGLESVLREVKANTVNKGRSFWSCSRFGGPSHLRRCDFFRWDSNLTDENDAGAESSSSARNRPNNSELPYVLISAYTNNENNNNINNDSEVNLSPCPDQLSVNEVIIPPRSRFRTTTITTPPTTPHQRNRNFDRRASSSQAPGSPPTNSQSPSPSNVANTRNLTGDICTRSPAVFGNWVNVPKYSTPQLLDIVQNHLVQQDKNYKNWFTATQTAKKDLEEARKEMEKLKSELEISIIGNDLYKRENDVLKGEKRLLELENDRLKEENQELKRRRS